MFTQAVSNQNTKKTTKLPPSARNLQNSSVIIDPHRQQLLRVKKIELEASIFSYKPACFLMYSTVIGKKYSPKEIQAVSYDMPDLEKGGHKALFEANVKTNMSVYQMNTIRFKEFLKSSYTIYKEINACLEKNKPKRNALVRMKQMFDDIRFDSSVVYLTGPATKTGGFVIESKDCGEEELMLAELVNEWKKRNSKQKHLLVILEFNYSGKWARELSSLKVPDVSVLASCREKDRMYATPIGGIFMHNFLKYLNKNQCENLIVVDSLPVFAGDYLRCKKWTNFYVNFKDWTSVIQIQKSDFTEITYENGKYIGYMNNAQKHHWGMFLWTTGLFKDCQFFGEFNAGQLQGKGIMVYKSGRFYEGDFYQNAPEGYGEEVFENGDSYHGKYKKGFKVGFGVYTYYNSDIYKGEFADNKPDGNGILTLKNGSIYEGSFKGGKCNGIGVFRYKNGDVYEGEWVNSLKHGNGKYSYTNGDVYEGQFVNGVRHGIGKLVTATGEIYNGEWAMDTMSGKGEYKTDHSKTIGEWDRGNYTQQPTFFTKIGSKCIATKLV